MEERKDFYVYIYLDQNNIPFYVGKGQKDRWKIRTHLTSQVSNPHLNHKLLKIGSENIKIYFLCKNLTEKEAFQWEKYWIKSIGREDKHEGTLLNYTDGGEGSVGYLFTDEQKVKLSIVHKGTLNGFYGKCHTLVTCKAISKGLQKRGFTGEKNPNYGKKTSQEICKKISNSLKGFKHSEDTKKQMSLSHTGKSFTIEHRDNLSKALKGKKKLQKSKDKISKSGLRSEHGDNYEHSL